MAIHRFEGEFFFLSNFYEDPVILGGVSFRTAEHAFQAAKCATAGDVQRIVAAASPGAAKKAGRKVQMRPDWETIKYDAMRAVIQSKFSDPVLAAKLLATGDQELIEGNNWGDKTWGQVAGKGNNWLGIILMAVRGEIQDARETA